MDIVKYCYESEADLGTCSIQQFLNDIQECSFRVRVLGRIQHVELVFVALVPGLKRDSSSSRGNVGLRLGCGG